MRRMNLLGIRKQPLIPSLSPSFLDKPENRTTTLIHQHPFPNMNILCILLLLVLIQHVAASKRKVPASPHEQETFLMPTGKRPRIKDLSPIQLFEKELKNKRMAPASRIYESGDNDFKRLCAEHLFSLGSDRAAGLIDGTTPMYKLWALKALLLYADTAFVGAVFDNLGRDAHALFKSAVYDAEVASRLGMIFYLIGKVSDEAVQVDIAANAADALFKAKKRNAYSNLISALRKKTINHPNLKEKVTSKIFHYSIYIDDGERCTKRYFDRPEVSSHVYAEALCKTYYRTKDPESAHVKWLMARADLEDLKMVKNRKKAFEFSTLPTDFQLAITNAMKDTFPEPRIGVRARRKELGRVLYDDITIPKVLIQLILQYYYYDWKSFI